MDGDENSAKVADKNGKTIGIITRPNASPGYWLCTLLPLAFLVSGYHQPRCSLKFEYIMISVTLLGLCLQSVNFFLYIVFDIGGSRLRKMLFLFLPGVAISILYYFLLHQKPLVCMCWGFGVTLFYQFLFISLVKGLPKTFSFGEAAIAAQGLTVFLLNAILQIALYTQSQPTGDFGKMNAIMIAALFFLCVACCLLSVVRILRSTFMFYLIITIYAISVCVFPITQNMPLLEVINFITSDPKKSFLIIYYIGLVGATCCTVYWQLGSKASTRTRKIFHILVVLVYVPGLLLQCTLLYLATGVVFAVLTILEMFRIYKIAPFGKVFNDSVVSFCDEKDAGIIALTPFCLLVGCSLPMWINPCPCTLSDSAGENLIPLLSGVLSIGVGDTAASVIGSTIGKHKWPNSKKSIEGTLAFIVFQALAIIGLFYLNLIHLYEETILSTAAAIVISGLTEAFTDQIDNLVLPLLFYIIVSVV